MEVLKGTASNKINTDTIYQPCDMVDILTQTAHCTSATENATNMLLASLLRNENSEKIVTSAATLNAEICNMRLQVSSE